MKFKEIQSYFQYQASLLWSIENCFSTDPEVPRWINCNCQSEKSANEKSANEKKIAYEKKAPTSLKHPTFIVDRDIYGEMLIVAGIVENDRVIAIELIPNGENIDLLNFIAL